MGFRIHVKFSSAVGWLYNGRGTGNTFTYFFLVYFRKFAPRCCMCRNAIMPEQGKEETVRVVAMDKSFHVSCYKCEVSTWYYHAWVAMVMCCTPSTRHGQSLYSRHHWSNGVGDGLNQKVEGLILKELSVFKCQTSHHTCFSASGSINWFQSLQEALFRAMYQHPIQGSDTPSCLML
jgi:hypothetical protein